MLRPNLFSVHLAARIAIARHGHQALEVAEDVLSLSSNPEFAKAVAAEIRRLLEETHH